MRPWIAGIRLLGLAAAVGCAPHDGGRMRFDVPAQPAASALNAFAAQADIALIFSYDRVAGLRTPALRGRYTVEAGLSRLLQDTGLAHRRAGAGAYLVCAPADCAAGDADAGR